MINVILEMKASHSEHRLKKLKLMNHDELAHTFNIKMECVIAQAVYLSICTPDSTKYHDIMM